MNKKRLYKFNKILRDIKSVKIQGARNIAKAALYAYSLQPTKSAKQKLIKARPTEPMLINVLNKIEKNNQNYKKIFSHFNEAQDKINKNVLKIIKSKSIIFTHCHSTNVVNALIYAKRHGKRFQVYNTETRPLFQGRKTSRELEKAGIKVTMMTDLAAGDALSKGGKIEKADLILFGADAILKNGVINKIGSGMFAEIACNNKMSVYIIADSWKFSPRNVKIEERSFKEIWKNAPRHIKIKNPAFEKISRKYIKAIVSELGILSFSNFLRKVKKN